MFVILALTHLYLKIKGKNDSETDKLVLYWKQRFEFVFIALLLKIAKHILHREMQLHFTLIMVREFINFIIVSCIQQEQLYQTQEQFHY
jgi:hypothetical protein